MSDERLFLSSEINQLKELLANLPAENLIERISLEARLANVQQQLTQLSNRQHKTQHTLHAKSKYTIP